MLRIRQSLLVIVAASFASWSTAGCGDDDPSGPQDPGPTAGTLTLTLSTPNADDGAILLVVTGPDMTQVEPTDPSLYFQLAEVDGRITALFVGDVTGGDLLRFHVPDLDALASYIPTIVDLADRDNELRDSAGYELTLD